MGIGLVCSLLSMLLSGFVETVRRRRAISEGFENNPLGVINMSAFWTILHSFFFGLAEAFYAIGQIEFFYSQLPKDMMSIAGSVFGLGGALGTLLAILVLNITASVTKKGGSEGWISTNVNKGHYDYYCYLLAVLNFFNVLYYIYVSRAYGPIVERGKVVQEEGTSEELVLVSSTTKNEKAEVEEEFGSPKLDRSRKNDKADLKDKFGSPKLNSSKEA